MSIDAIVFSRDRPAQLDLLLTSLERNAPWLRRVTVLYRDTSPLFVAGYVRCKALHPRVTFVREETGQFRLMAQVIVAARDAAPYLVAFCDDDVMFRVPRMPPTQAFVNFGDSLLCMSLRLGRNTRTCYSLRVLQKVPAYPSAPIESISQWEWRHADADFGYPGSLDGHIFRTEHFRILTGMTDDWANPNELEDVLHRATRTCLLPYMASYAQSCLVGVPVNLVNDTHRRNRHGEAHPTTVEDLNDRFLDGDRLDLSTVNPRMVDAAHVEFPLVWKSSLKTASKLGARSGV